MVNSGPSHSTASKSYFRCRLCAVVTMVSFCLAIVMFAYTVAYHASLERLVGLHSSTYSTPLTNWHENAQTSR